MNVKGKNRTVRSGLVSIAGFFSILPFALGAIVVATYLLYTNDQLGGADSGELIGASYNWGIAHPPGYPLYIVAGKLFSLLSPFESVVYTYNLFSTLCFFAAIIFAYKALRLFETHPLAIFLGGALFLFSPLTLRWMTKAEVFALHILICAAGIYLACLTIKKGRFCKASRWLGLIVGLGASNHHSLVFLLPGFLLVYLHYWLRLPFLRLRMNELLWFLGTTCLGLLFYLEPLLVSHLQGPPVSCLGMEVKSFSDLLDLFLRRLYGTFNLVSVENEGLSPFFWLGAYIQTGLFSIQGLTPLAGILVAIFPLVVWRRSRSLFHLTLMVWFGGAISFFLLWNAHPSGFARQDILPRMYLMPNLIASLLAIICLDFLGRRIKPFFSDGQVTGLSMLISLLVLWFSIFNGTRGVVINPVDIELTAGRDILDGCSLNGVLLLSADTTAFSTFYLQEVERYRRDVIAVVWHMTKKEKYRDLVLKKLLVREWKEGSTAEQAACQTDFSSLDLITLLIKRGVGVYTMLEVVEQFPDEGKNMPLLDRVPEGIVGRLVLAGTGPDTKELLDRNASPIASYMSWLSEVDFDHHPPVEQAILDIYLDYFKYMRQTQFTTETLMLPLNLFEKLCQFIRLKDPHDVISDYYLGVFYCRYKRNGPLAVRYLTRFLTEADDNARFAKAVENSRTVLELLSEK